MGTYSFIKAIRSVSILVTGFTWNAQKETQFKRLGRETKRKIKLVSTFIIFFLELGFQAQGGFGEQSERRRGARPQNRGPEPVQELL